MITGLESVLSKFQIKGVIDEVALFGGGHINDTYRVLTSENEYLLQRINTNVFRDVGVMETNLQLLLGHKPEILVRHIQDKNGKLIHADETGAWKVQDFNDSVYAPNFAENIDLVRQVGIGFGGFMNLNQNLKPDQFGETIPKFHDLDWRQEQLKEAITNDAANRSGSAQNLITEAVRFEWVADRIQELKKVLPIRVCHNDTKIDNILLSKGDDFFKHVIDLDTVGPGYALYDFGDMMRTMLSPTRENEKDETKIAFRRAYFDAVKESYTSRCSDLLTDEEIRSLPFGGLYMTYIMAIRFLTDYLNGDVYYKVSFDKENYIRARNQFILLRLIHENLF